MTQNSPARLARPEDAASHDALTHAINQNPHESTPRLAFADFLQENGVPGAAIMRDHVVQTERGFSHSPHRRIRELLGGAGHTQFGDVVSVHASGDAYTGPFTTGAFEEHTRATGAPLMQVFAGPPRTGVVVGMRYGSPTGEVSAIGHARTADELHALLQDVPPEARTRLLQSLHERGLLQRALVGKGSRSFKLSRPVRLAAIQPPTGGQPTVTVRVPVPQPVPIKPAAPAPPPAPAKKPSGPAFILPG